MNLGIGGHTRPREGKSNDWITPAYIIEALGDFDLDPCACDPQPWPCALRSFTKEDDGLSRKWQGRVWCNPPYGKEAWPFLERLAQHKNGTALIFARTETEGFFEHVWSKAYSLLFLKKRIHFCYPDGTRAKTNSGGPSVLVAYDKNNSQKLRHSGLEGAHVRFWSGAGD